MEEDNKHHISSADEARHADAKTLTEPMEALLDALVDAVVALSDATIGWQAIIACVGMTILGGVTFILVILALSSFRILGFVVNARWYAVSAAFSASAALVIFSVLLYFVIRKILLVRSLAKKLRA